MYMPSHLLLQSFTISPGEDGKSDVESVVVDEFVLHCPFLLQSFVKSTATDAHTRVTLRIQNYSLYCTSHASSY